MAPRRYTDVSPEEAERLKKQRDRMRLYRAKIKEKQKELKEAHLSHVQHTQRQQQNFKLPIPPLPRSASTGTRAAPSSKAAQRASELEIVRVHEAHELMKAWQAAPSYVPVGSFYDRPVKKESTSREEVRRLQQRERQRKCRIKMKERYGRNSDGEGTAATTAVVVGGNGISQSTWNEENDEIQILDSNEENDTNHKILRSYLQKAREARPSDNGHHSFLEGPPVVCEYFESPNEKMLPKRRRGLKVGYHEQIEPNVTLLEASDGTLVPLRVLNQGYQDFDDLMEIELVELGNLEKQTQTPDAWQDESGKVKAKEKGMTKELELVLLLEEIEKLKLDNERLKLENKRLKLENAKLELKNDEPPPLDLQLKIKSEPESERPPLERLNIKSEPEDAKPRLKLEDVKSEKLDNKSEPDESET